MHPYQTIFENYLNGCYKWLPYTQLWAHDCACLTAEAQHSTLRTPGLHARPMDVAATFSFASSTRSKAECVSHQHTDTQTHLHGLSHRLPQPRMHPHRARTPHQYRQLSHLLTSVWHRQQLLGAGTHTHSSRLISCCMHTHPRQTWFGADTDTAPSS